MNNRRQLLTALPLVGASLAATPATPPAAAAARRPTDRFPGDPPEHRIVYQLNQAGADYIEHILNSVGAMLGKYQDNIAIVVVAFGPGIHLLATRPGRPVPDELRERARGQSKDYGVRFVACGNTMGSLGWTAKDIRPFAQIEAVGAATLMELQEQGYAYIAW